MFIHIPVTVSEGKLDEVNRLPQIIKAVSRSIAFLSAGCVSVFEMEIKTIIN